MFAQFCITVLVTALGAAGEKPVLSNPFVVESLLRTAENLYHQPDEKVRAGRLVALCNLLIDARSDDLRAGRLIRDVSWSMGRLKQAAFAAEQIMKTDTRDYGSARKWLYFRLRTKNTAEDRISFLNKVIESETYSNAIRSDAAVELAGIHIARGARKQAGEVVGNALQLNSCNTEALLLSLEMKGDSSPADEVKMMFSMLRNNPASITVTRELALRFGRLGLHTESLSLHGRAWRMGESMDIKSVEKVTQATEYLSALLDGDRAEEAVKLFLDTRMKYLGSPEFLALLTEACVLTDRKKEAADIVEELERKYQKRLSDSVKEGEANNPDAAMAAMDMAWFELLVKNKPDKALEYAKQAIKTGEKGKGPEIIEGVSRLGSEPEKGIGILTPLAKKYALAAALFAEYLLDNGKTDAAEKVIAGAFVMGRSGLAYRKLARLAKKHNLATKPMPGSETAAGLLKNFDKSYLRVGEAPSEFVRITIVPSRKNYLSSGPVQVEFVLENVSNIPLTIDQSGMVDRRIVAAVSVEGLKGKGCEVMPSVLLPAPLILAPGRKVSVVKRLDSGALDRFLTLHPMKTYKIRVRGIISPLNTGRRIVSSVPAIKEPEITLVRTGLLHGAEEKELVGRYRQVVESLQKDLSSAVLADRVKAARNTGSILSWYWEVRQGRVKAERTLVDSVKEDTLIGLLSTALGDKSPVVRAEILASLQFAQIPASRLGKLASAITDPDPLVRFRMADLIGSSDTRGRIKLMEIFARDNNRHVRFLAGVFMKSADPASGDNGS